MKEIAIVKRRARVLPAFLALLLVALLVLAGLWMLGMLPGVAPPRVDVLNMIGADGGRSVLQTSFQTSIV
jgi:hypothetical protein